MACIAMVKVVLSKAFLLQSVQVDDQLILLASTTRLAATMRMQVVEEAAHGAVTVDSRAKIDARASLFAIAEEVMFGATIVDVRPAFGVGGIKEAWHGDVGRKKKQKRLRPKVSCIRSRIFSFTTTCYDFMNDLMIHDTT